MQLRYITIAYILMVSGGIVQSQQNSLLPFEHVSAVIYDNDDHRDVYTDEYLICLSHLGKIDLKCILTTYAPNEREYNLFVEGRESILEKARKSGLKNLPVVMAGTSKRLTKPASNHIKDTKPLNLKAAHFIIEHARKATPERPLSRLYH